MILAAPEHRRLIRGAPGRQGLALCARDDTKSKDQHLHSKKRHGSIKDEDISLLNWL